MKKYALSLASLLLAHNALATEFNNGIGASGSWSNSPYLGASTDFTPMPLIDYDSERIFISGLSGGVHIWNDQHQQLDISMKYQSIELDPADNDDVRMKQLNHRRTTLLAGLAYALTTPYGQFSTEVLTDVLNKSDTVSVELEYAAYFALTDKLSIIPQFGVTWFNRSHNRYYYGVTSQESSSSGFNQYRPGSGLMPYAVLTASYQLNSRWSAVFEYEYDWLDSKVKSSPIVNRSGINTLTAGILYHF